MNPNRDKQTIPDMPMAIRKTHRPTLVMKTAIDEREEKERERREIGRYSVIPGRSQS